MLKTICVTSAKSDLGKTSLIQKLLKKLDNWAACKVTTVEEGKSHRCPKAVRCGVCASFVRREFHIEDKKEVIGRPGTDTDRMLRAGSRKTFWIVSRPKSLARAIKNVINRSRGCDGVIFEGNHALKFLNPDVSVLIAPDSLALKKSAKDIIHKIDIHIKDIKDAKVVDTILALLK